MDIHRPKAAHSLAEFAREMGAVILGILIALGLEQGVEAYHWNQRVRDAHRALAVEIQDQVNTYALRAAVTPCVERRLAEIEAILADLDHGRHVAPVADFARPLGSSNHQDIWQALGAAGILAHFDPEELIAYSKLYEVSSQVDSWSTMGGQDWSAIKLVVGDPNRLDPSGRALVQVAINHTRALNYVWARQARLQLERARKFGAAAPTPPDLAAIPECQPLKRG